MAAHRHWALLVTARPGSGNGVGLAEVEMRATPGGADQCVGGTAGGVNNVGKPPANAFDNDDTTIWHDGATGGSPTRLSYDFGTPVSVAEIFLRNAPASGTGSGFPGATYGPGACWVQWSDNGTDWVFGGPTVDLSSLGNAETVTLAATDVPPVGRITGGFVQLSPGVPTPQNRLLSSPPLQYDAVDGGPYRVAGTVKIDGTPATPVARRVRLHDVISGRLVRQVWSAADGSFSFERIRAGEYIVISDDYTRTYNAVVADRVSAVL